MPVRTYFDWNATAPIRESARNAMMQALEVVGNPSSVHKEGRAARAMIETARQQVAELCGVDADRVVFTSGATEAAALTLNGSEVHSSAVEHPAILAWTVPDLPINERGQVEVTNPAISAVQLANSETGLLQDIPPGTRMTDATQALGKIKAQGQVKKANYAIVSAHKLGGPKGVGAVIINAPEYEIKAQLKGGGQEFNRRSGTENLYGIAGFGAAAEEAGNDLSAGRWEEVESLRNKLENLLKDEVKDIVIFAEHMQRLPNTSCFAVPGWKGMNQVMSMDLNGFAVSAGAACSSGKVRSGDALKALGASPELADSAIRVSIGPTTGRRDIERFVASWTRAHKRVRSRKQIGGNGQDMSLELGS